MRNFSIIRSALLIIFLSTSTLSLSQRTGNIVEYFGKEKVEDVSEGDVIHVFHDALLVNLNEVGLNSSTFPKDPVFDEFLMNNSPSIKEGDVFGIDEFGKEMIWKKISTDSTNSFSGRNMRSGYVYLSYNSASARTVLFEASGHTVTSVNGMPHEGDHYDFGYNLIPMQLKKGKNVFVLKVGRFPRVRARILKPYKPVEFTTRDMTMPDVLFDGRKDYVGGIRIINSTANWIKGYSVKAQLEGGEKITRVPAIPPYSVYKIPVEFTGMETATESNNVALKLSLLNSSKRAVDTKEITLGVKSKYKHHKRTFISDVDGSVQYFSVAPSLDKAESGQALFFSVHGASVEAVNQANAYQQKDWGTLVAPTNRRPFGYAWEDLGRLDALEVLKEAKRIYQPDPSRIYLTGHSMGGHGTWYLGATYPDHWAAIAPCAGYPDLLIYRDNRREWVSNNDAIDDKTKKRLLFEPTPTATDEMLERAGNPSRTLKLINNYNHFGVYILHGEIDDVVPTKIARDMRERLGKFHGDMTYYEYPGGTHWYGNHSVDWKPIFDFFNFRTIKSDKDIDRIDFSTASPGVSASSHYVSIEQQIHPFEISNFKLKKENDSLNISTENVALISLDMSKIEGTANQLVLDGKNFSLSGKNQIVYFKQDSGNWIETSKPSMQEKGPHRNGGFKDAFRNNVVLVYATKGSKEENDWYYNKARFDAERMWYQANGKAEMVADKDFDPKNYADRNVVLYGNRDNNAAWNKLLKDAPVQVMNGAISFDGREVNGDQWGTYFITSRKDSDTASVGVVSATGKKGMKAAYANNYLLNGTTFPDLIIFDDNVLIEGTPGVKCTGFFGNDWSVKNGDFSWK